MANRKSLASVLLFVGSALCFFLPFVTVSCGGVKAFTLSGRQLAMGTTIEQPRPFGGTQKQPIAADPFAAMAGICAVAGVALTLAGRKLSGASAASGGLGAILLLIMRSHLSDQLQKQAMGMAKADFEGGFTITLLLLIAAAGWNAYLFLQNRKPAASEAPPGALNHQAEARL